MADIVIDLETMDTRLSAKVVSIGAAKVKLKKSFGNCIVSCFYIELDWRSQIGRTESKETKQFWKEQSMEARAGLNGNWPLLDGINELSRFIDREDYVWGNGSIFDIGILQDCYEKEGIEVPWQFSRVNDFRTIKRKYEEKFGNFPYLDFEGVKHNALDDAKYEAKLLHKMWNSL